MKQAADNDEQLTRYLLGEMSEDEQEGVEQRYIGDPEFYERLLTVEDDLIDAYAEGSLSQSQRSSFEDHFLRSPDRQARVAFAKAWMAYVSRQSKAPRAAPSVPKSSFPFVRIEGWPVALRVAVVLLLLAGGAFLISETMRLRSRVELADSQRAELEKTQKELQQQIEEERTRAQELSSQLERERELRSAETNPTDQQSSGIISMLLTPGLVRGASDAKRLILPSAAHEVRLQVTFESADYDNYGVIIKTVDGDAIWSKAGLKAQPIGSGKGVAVRVPANLLTTEDYILTLTGIKGAGAGEAVSEYFFSVSKK